MMSKNFQNKNIPYKYIVEKQNGEIVFEHIHVESINGEVVNRCLSVPNNVKTKFTKFDDVILGEKRPNDKPAGVNFTNILQAAFLHQSTVEAA